MNPKSLKPWVKWVLGLFHLFLLHLSQGMWNRKRLCLLQLYGGYLQEKTIINLKTYLCLLPPSLMSGTSVDLGRGVWSWRWGELLAKAAWPHSGSQAQLCTVLTRRFWANLGERGK